MHEAIVARSELGLSDSKAKPKSRPTSRQTAQGTVMETSPAPGAGACPFLPPSAPAAHTLPPTPGRASCRALGLAFGQPCPGASGGSRHHRLPGSRSWPPWSSGWSWRLSETALCGLSHLPPSPLSLLINTGGKRAGSRSEGSVPNGLAASLEGAGGEGALTCCSAGPAGRRCQTLPTCSALPKPHRVGPCPDEGTRMSCPMSTRPGISRGHGGGLGAEEGLHQAELKTGLPGGQVASPAAGGAGVGAQTWAAQRTWSQVCPQLSRCPRRPVCSVPCP